MIEGRLIIEFICVIVQEYYFVTDMTTKHSISLEFIERERRGEILGLSRLELHLRCAFEREMVMRAKQS